LENQVMTKQRSYLKWITLIASCLLGFFLFRGGGAARPEPQKGLEQWRSIHPRLLLTQEKQKSLQTAIGSTHRFLWERYLQDLPRMKAVARGERPVGDLRYLGDLVPELAFTWLMTGDEADRQLAVSHLLSLTDKKRWGAEEDLAYLIPSHFLLGMSLGYDWLYSAMTPSERQTIAVFLGEEAEKQYRAITRDRIWWRNQYFQNHSHSNTCGLAFAAAALAGVDPRADRWLEICEKFFEKTFQVMPSDGGSLEGYAYAGYGAEYLLKYALMSRQLLDKDYSGSPWMKNFAGYLIHGLLPYRTGNEWAMTFGDAPRRGWTSTAQHLFLLAGLYKDPAAQWMAKTTLALQPQGLGSHGWLMLLGYDPSVKDADPAGFSTFRHFAEIDQVMMRSSWTDPDAMLVGFKCGPFMGRTLSPDAVFDYGTGHAAPDAGAFEIFSRRQFWAIDPLYPGVKRTANYNTMLFKGVGQLGEQAAFGSMEALYFKHYPHVIHAAAGSAYDYTVGDVTRAYHPALGLRRFIRHLLFIKPDILLVADEVELLSRGMVHNYHSDRLQTAGGLTHASNGYVVGTEGEAFTLFDGEDGQYQLTAVYLDNHPGIGNYALEVDGKPAHRWQSRNEEKDDHLIAVSPPVFLKKGSRISFRAAPFVEEGRLIKLTAFSSEVKTPLSAEWLLHFDPHVQLKKDQSRCEASLGDARLDLYSLAPADSSMSWKIHSIDKPVEPFTFRQTLRLSVEPRFKQNQVTLLNLIHTRSAAALPLQQTSATVQGSRVRVQWLRGGQKTTLDWDLRTKKINLR
jgi:hypothetical protein